METLSTLNVCVQGGIRREVFEGKDYLVAPVIAMTEGVRNGSMGPVLYLAEEYGKFPESWNGVPLPVFHPEDINGNYVSCNTPEIIENQSVGRLFNVVLENNKLKGEIWIDIEKAKQVDPEVLVILESGQRLEISTSHWSDDEKFSGDFGGKHYKAIARNVRPDHLALLPGGKGACNWEHGCGAPRANMEGGEKMPDETSLSEKVKAKFKYLAKELGLSVQEVSHDKVRGELQKTLDALDTTEKVDAPVIHYVRDVYDKYFVYEQQSQEGLKLYKQDYKKQKNDNIKLEGKPQEVKEDTSYKAVKSNQNQGGDKNMDKIKELVNGLIANTSTKYTEDDREFLQGLSECQLSRMAPVVNEVTKPCEEAVKLLIANEGSPFEEKDKELLSNMSEEQFRALAVKYPVKKEEPSANADEKPKTFEELLEHASPETQEMVSNGVKLHKEQKEVIIKELSVNKRNRFTPEQLKAKSLDELKNLAELAVVEVDFSGNGGGLTGNVDHGEVLKMPVMDFKEK